MKDQLTNLRDRLTDLTRRNRSLRLLLLYNKWNLDLFELDKIQPGLGLKVITKVMSRYANIRLTDLLSDNEDELIINHRLKTLARNINEIEIEKGLLDLYVGYPFIKGRLLDETFIQAPIFLVPIRLEKRSESRSGSTYWSLKSLKDEEVLLNRTLILGLQKYNEITISEKIFEETEELPKLDWLNQAEQILRKYSIKCSLDQDLNDQIITRFTQYRKKEIPDIPVGKLTICPFGVLGHFPQSTSALLRDYEMLLDCGGDLGLVNRLLLREDSVNGEKCDLGEISIDAQPEQENISLLPTDNSQEEVLIAVRSGENLVVHGPPGTGKSQVIVNLIGESVCKGKTILVVCQKRAALDVVFQRFQSLGLSDNISLVHDAKSDRKDIFKNIESLLNQNRDVEQIRNSFRELSADIQQKTQYLNRVASALWSQQPCGVSPFQLYTAKYDYEGDLLDLGDLGSQMTKKQLDDFLGNLEKYGKYYAKYGNSQYSLKHRKSFAGFGILDFTGFKRDTKQAIQSARNLEIVLDNNKWLTFLPGRTLDLKEELSQAALLYQQRKDSGLKPSLERLMAEKNALKTQFNAHSKVEQIEKIEKYLIRLEKWPRPAKNFSIEEANDAKEIIKNWSDQDARLLKFFNPSWWYNGHQLRKICKAKDINYSRREVPDLYYSLNSFLHWRYIEHASSKYLKFCEMQVNENVQPLRDSLITARTAIEFILRMQRLPSEISTLLPQTEPEEQNLDSHSWLKFEERVVVLSELGKKADNLIASLNPLKGFLSDKLIEGLVEGARKGRRISIPLEKALKHLEEDDIHLQQMDLLYEKFENDELRMLRQCELMGLPGDAQLGKLWGDAIRKTFYTYWIDVAENELPVLREISTGQFDVVRDNYRNLIEDKRENVALFIKSLLANKTADFIETSGQTFRSMRNQVGKKRRLWPLRKFIESFGDEGLFDLLPCWLVSPETVSSIFPFKKGMFDIVIFDEASQCPVENAIPTFYRAKQAVVAGDEKQLPPMKLFQAGFSYEEDEYEDEIVDSDSLLASAKLVFPDVMLKWHYRSKHEELINFSNHAFYNGGIQISPNVSRSVTSPVIDWLQIDGIWANQCNTAEADAAVHLIKLLFKNHPAKTVGVITFNMNQKIHILDVIDDFLSKDIEFKTLYEKQLARPLDEQLFVRNIENVQGDERDIIIFSVGYGRAVDGRVRLNFGTLSRVGGENRLNVAITRAKEKIYLICSIDPDTDLNVGNTRNPGPKYLKEYLRYARAQSAFDDELAKNILGGFGTWAPESEALLFESPFEEQVYDAIKQHGLDVDTQVGCSNYRIDLAIRHPEENHRYILGIECDGATYHSSRSAKERDVYRQRFLESRGWTIERIWSRNWWRNQESEIQRVLRRIAELKTQRQKSSVLSVSFEDFVESDAVKPPQILFQEPTMEEEVAPLEEGIGEIVELGDKVSYRDLDNNEVVTWSIVAGMSEPEEGTISNLTPIGNALLGHSVGDVVEVETPGGVKELELTEVKKNPE